MGLHLTICTYMLVAVLGAWDTRGVHSDFHVIAARSEHAWIRWVPGYRTAVPPRVPVKFFDQLAVFAMPDIHFAV